eukprot:7869618-Pyramimonas_sp.AAC.1
MTWRKQQQRQADEKRREREKSSFRAEVKSTLDAHMMCTQEYALRHAAYKPPPEPREMKQYKQQVEDRMLKLAELL